MANYYLLMHGRGADLGNFKIFSDSYRKTVEKADKHAVVVQESTERALRFRQVLEAWPITNKIKELHIWSHSIGAGLFLGYHDPLLSVDRSAFIGRLQAAGRKATFEEVRTSEIGALFTDDLVSSSYTAAKTMVRPKFAKDAFVKVWGCNAAIAGWIYTDTAPDGSPISDPADVSVPYYWRALNEKNQPKPSIAQALADFFGVISQGLRRRALVKLSLLAIIFLPCNSAFAWENDVHYGLTKWLAQQVGFTLEQSEWIASGNQGVDDSYITGPIVSTAASSCFTKDDSGAKTVANNHYPARYLPPAAAARRIVVKGEPYRDLRPLPRPPVDSSKSGLKELGRYLHALQDSWSHQGEPDIPLHCDSEYAWGHALDRGGWSCHLADLTHKWVDADAIPMAQATYEALESAYGREAAVTWEVLSDRIATFARLDNKFEKAQWFKAQGFKNHNEFIAATSLKNCPSKQQQCFFDYAFEEARGAWVDRVKKLPPLSTQMRKEARDTLVKFVSAMVAGDEKMLDSLIERKLAQVAMERALHVNPSCASLYETYFKSSLLSGFITAKGAQQPNAMCELAMKIQAGEPGVSCSAATLTAVNASSEAQARGPQLTYLLDKAISPNGLPHFSISNAPQTGKAKGDAEYWAMAYFPHLPRDRLAIRVSMVGKTYKVSAFIWQPDE